MGFPLVSSSWLASGFMNSGFRELPHWELRNPAVPEPRTLFRLVGSQPVRDSGANRNSEAYRGPFIFVR